MNFFFLSFSLSKVLTYYIYVYIGYYLYLILGTVLFLILPKSKVESRRLKPVIDTYL